MNKSILLIEDEKMLSDILGQKLENEGYAVISARNGEEGLDMINSQKPDLILLDMIMPKMTGFEVMEQMKRDKITIPVIVISNSGQPVDIGKALDLGAKDYIIKAELDPDEIVNKVVSTLNAAELASIDNRPTEGKIMIAEDDDFLRELFEKKMKKLGYEPLLARDGIEALEMARILKPSVLLLDVMMPGIDGFGVLQQIRSDKDIKINKIPVIILSNLGNESDIKRGKELGADDYLIKAEHTIDQIILKIKKYI